MLLFKKKEGCMKKTFFLFTIMLLISNSTVLASSDDEIAINCSISTDNISRYSFPLYIDDVEKKLYRAKHIEITGQKVVFNGHYIKITDSGLGAPIPSLILDRKKGTVSMILDTYSSQVGKMLWEGTCSKL